MGFRHVPNKEWGRKHRKEEDRMRGLNGKDRRQAVDEQLEDLLTVPFLPPPPLDPEVERMEVWRTIMFEERLRLAACRPLRIDQIAP
jgi:hypothetical protein